MPTLVFGREVLKFPVQRRGAYPFHGYGRGPHV